MITRFRPRKSQRNGQFDPWRNINFWIIFIYGRHLRIALERGAPMQCCGSVYLCPLTVVRRLWNEIHRKRERNKWQVAIGFAWDLAGSDGSLSAAGGETEDHLGCKFKYRARTNTKLKLRRTGDPFGKLPFLSTCQPLLLCCRPVLTQLLVAWRRIPFARLLFPPAVIICGISVAPCCT